MLLLILLLLSLLLAFGFACRKIWNRVESRKRWRQWVIICETCGTSLFSIPPRKDPTHTHTGTMSQPSNQTITCFFLAPNSTLKSCRRTHTHTHSSERAALGVSVCLWLCLCVCVLLQPQQSSKTRMFRVVYLSYLSKQKNKRGALSYHTCMKQHNRHIQMWMRGSCLTFEINIKKRGGTVRKCIHVCMYYTLWKRERERRILNFLICLSFHWWFIIYWKYWNILVYIVTVMPVLSLTVTSSWGPNFHAFRTFSITLFAIVLGIVIMSVISWRYRCVPFSCVSTLWHSVTLTTQN